LSFDGDESILGDLRRLERVTTSGREENLPHTKTAKYAKESKNNRKGIRKEAVLGDLGVLERATASGRAMKPELGMLSASVGTYCLT